MFGPLRKNSTAGHQGRFATPARGLSLAVGLAVGALVLGTVGPAEGSESKQTSKASALGTQPTAKAAVPSSVSAPLQRARTALDSAVTGVQRHHRVKAIEALDSLKNNIQKAHRAAKAQIGAPPLDPESDDAPGPPSIMAVLKLEHQVGVNLVPLFDHRSRVDLVQALRGALVRADNRRDNMVDAVVALPPEGDGADYADGMADTLGQYTSEITLFKGAIKTYTLTDLGKTSLQTALSKVQETSATMNRAYGGGE